MDKAEAKKALDNGTWKSLATESAKKPAPKKKAKAKKAD